MTDDFFDADAWPIARGGVRQVGIVVAALGALAARGAIALRVILLLR